MSDLKNCPMCGGEAIYRYPERCAVSIGCVECLFEKTIKFKRFSQEWAEEKLYSEWNTRPIEDALKAENARLKAENDRLREALEELVAYEEQFLGQRVNLATFMQKRIVEENAAKLISVMEKAKAAARQKE